jgi:hypothetical protein
MAKVLSEAVGVTMAPATLGTTPTSGWTKLQPDKGSIQNWKKVLETVERNIHSKNMTREKGDVVGWKVNPQFAHDCNKDYLDLHAEAMFRCAGKHPGTGGIRLIRPTAAVDGGGSADSFTHPAITAALVAGTLIYVRGCVNSANNGLFVVVAGSTTTSTKVATATLVAETLPANATLDVAGYQGGVGADEFSMNASGHIVSATVDMTTLGFYPGQRIIVGTGVLGTSAYSFATRACNVVAYVRTAAAHLLTLEDWVFEFAADLTIPWTPAADAGTGKTIRIITGSLYRNYAITDAEYSEKLLYGEKEDPRAGADGTTRYTDAKFLAVGKMTISAPLKNKITATAMYVGTDAGDPVAVADRTAAERGSAAGDSPANAYDPLATSLLDTANDLQLVRMYDSTGTIVNEINSWTLTLDNGVSPKEVQGTPARSITSGASTATR